MPSAIMQILPCKMGQHMRDCFVFMMVSSCCGVRTFSGSEKCLGHMLTRADAVFPFQHTALQVKVQDQLSHEYNVFEILSLTLVLSLVQRRLVSSLCVDIGLPGLITPKLI